MFDVIQIKAKNKQYVDMLFSPKIEFYRALLNRIMWILYKLDIYI